MAVDNSLFDMFVFETTQLLDQLEGVIINSESNGISGNIDEIFRIMHTIKGSAAMMMFDDISTLAHSIEDLFFFLREEKPEYVDYAQLTDLVLDAMDFIKVEIDQIQESGKSDAKSDEKRMRIRTFLDSLKEKENGEEAQAAAGNADTEETADSAEDAETSETSEGEDQADAGVSAQDDAGGSASSGEDVFADFEFTSSEHFAYITTIWFEEGSALEHIRAFELVNRLRNIAVELRHLPENLDSDDSMPEIQKNGITIAFASELEYEDIKSYIEHTPLIKTYELYVKDLRDTSHNEELTGTASQGVGKGKGNGNGADDDNGKTGAKGKNGDAEAVGERKGVADAKEAVASSSAAEKTAAQKTAGSAAAQTAGSADGQKAAQAKGSASTQGGGTTAAQGGGTNGARKATQTKGTASAQGGGAAAAQATSQTSQATSQTSAPAATQQPGQAGASNHMDNKPKDHANAASQLASATNVDSSGSKQGIISVNIAKLDKLMDLVGELVTSESMVSQNPDLAGLQLDNFNKAARQLQKIINELQDVSMSVRMVPLSLTFQKMNRIVRDMCRRLGKEVSLEIIGEETEVDKNIIEHITNPLMHLIRNAVDHGIEMPDVRERDDKPRSGTVSLEAKNESGDVWIIVRDDGAGLNKERIYEKARANGITHKSLEELTDREVNQFILMAGFSTNEEVTEFSGRGVGMDVVVKGIENVGGTVVLESEEGKGTVISIKIPLTLAIMDGLIVNVGETSFVIPITSIRESFKADESFNIADVNDENIIMIRGEPNPIIKLKDRFGLNSASESFFDGVMILVENEIKSLCLYVDSILGQRQVVVKPLPEYIKEVKGISGCTLLGDGTISLILDVADFLM